MTKHYIVINKSNGTILVEDALLANSFLMRLKGLLGRKGLDEGQGLIIKPCNAVHSFGMQFNIDLLFVSAENKVLKILKDFQPNKISPIVKGANYVIEMPSGMVEKKKIENYDLIEIISIS